MWKVLITFALLYSALAQENAETGPPTTTETTTTTTPAVNTTTTTTTTTTLAPVTTEAPSTYKYYNVSDTAGVVCIMIDGHLTFDVEYSIAVNKTNKTRIEVPKPSSFVEVGGSCDATNGSQHIKITWGEGLFKSSLRMEFSEITTDKTWTLKRIDSVIYMNKEHFPNATSEGSNLKSNFTIKLSPVDVPLNKSYKCFSSLTVSNITTVKDAEPYPHPVLFVVDSLHLQAFNEVPKQKEFEDEIHCDADKIADIVPIAVGCALAALIIVVLIAYIVGRRRRSASYQSV